MEVEPGEARLISSAALLARDADTPSTGVSYWIQNVPTRGVLQLMVRAQPNNSGLLLQEGQEELWRNSALLHQEGQDWLTLGTGGNWSQEEVDMNLLRYQHTGAEDHQAQDSFVFWLSDGKHQSPSQHFHISIKELEKGTGP